MKYEVQEIMITTTQNKEIRATKKKYEHKKRNTSNKKEIRATIPAKVQDSFAALLLQTSAADNWCHEIRITRNNNNYYAK